MTKRNIWFYGSLLVLITGAYFLLSGSPVLNIALDDAGAVPLGTFITWAGLIALPMAIYWGTARLRKPVNVLNRILSGVLKLILILAVLWVPISYLLAGNIAFNFSETATFRGGQLAMKIFWWLSGSLVAEPVLILFVYWTGLLFGKKQ